VKIRKKRWVVLLICSQILASSPVALVADVIDPSTDSELTVAEKINDEETEQTTASTTEATDDSSSEEQSTSTDTEEPAEPAEPEKPEESDEPEPAEPTEPEKPENPEPAEPAEPAEPTDPAEPTKPTKPTKPAKPSVNQGKKAPKSSNKPAANKKVTVPKPATNGNKKLPEMTIEGSADTSSITIEPAKDTWEFVDQIGEEAREIGKKNNLYASVMIAQAILESGSGQSTLARPPYYNLFGIKGSFQGSSVSLNTQEDNGGGALYSISANFRKYPGYKESLEDYAELLTEGLPNNKNYYRGAWKKETKNYKETTHFLTGRYATDINYDKKLNAIIKAYDLTEYDKATAKSSGNYQKPVSHYIISSGYGKRWGAFHRGIDFAVSQGTPIKAAKEGVVIKSEYHPSWGNYVVIRHNDGLTTLYAHASRLNVKVRQKVRQGQTVAYVGSTGNSTGPHLHFEVNRSVSLAQSSLLDPLKVLKNS